MASSGLYSLASHGSSIFSHMHGGTDDVGNGFDYEAFLRAIPILYSPLRLTADLNIALPASVSRAS